MFSKSKINEPGPSADTAKTAAPTSPAPAAPKASEFKASAPKAKPPASLLSADLHITGNMKTTGDINVEGTVEGDIRAHLLTIGESATIKGEVIADDVVVNGAASGRSAQFRRKRCGGTSGQSRLSRQSYQKKKGAAWQMQRPFFVPGQPITRSRSRLTSCQVRR